jgi:hypothetical protein
MQASGKTSLSSTSSLLSSSEDESTTKQQNFMVNILKVVD